MTVDFLIKIIITLGSLVAALTTIFVAFKKIIDNWLKKKFAGFTLEINELKNQIITVDVNQCRNFLVSYLADVEAGVTKDEIETKRAYECYEHYTKDLGKNSYIHDKWEKLMK